MQRLGEQPLTQSHGFIATQVLQIVADLQPGLAGHHMIEPRRVRGAVGRCDDLHMVAITQLGAHGHQLMVDARAGAALADVAVHFIGEIDDGGATRQFLDVPVGCKDIHLVGKEIDFQVLEKLARIAGLLLDFHQPLQPLECALLHADVAGLVQPVRRDAIFSHPMHVFRANLHLDQHAKRSEDDRVQGLISVGLRDGDVILEAPRDRLVEVVDDAENAVTRVHAVDYDTERQQIIHLLKGQALLAHLAVDAKQILFAPGDIAREAFATQLFEDGGTDLVDERLAVAVALAHRLLENTMPQGIEDRKTEILEFNRPAVQAQPIGDGGIDIQCLAGDGAPARRREHRDGAHVMQTVGELDQNDADIPRHGKKHLAKIFRLLLFLALEFDLTDLADAIDELCHLLTELSHQFVFVMRRVLDDIVEDGRGKTGRIETQTRQELCDLQGMIDVGLAGAAALPFVGLRAKEVGAIDEHGILAPEVALDERQEIADVEGNDALRFGLRRGAGLRRRLSRRTRCHRVRPPTRFPRCRRESRSLQTPRQSRAGPVRWVCRSHDPQTVPPRPPAVAPGGRQPARAGSGFPRVQDNPRQ